MTTLGSLCQCSLLDAIDMGTAEAMLENTPLSISFAQIVSNRSKPGAITLYTKIGFV